jgi:hypothetical protein
MMRLMPSCASASAERRQLGVNNAWVLAGLGEKQVEFALPMPKQNHDGHPFF